MIYKFQLRIKLKKKECRTLIGRWNDVLFIQKYFVYYAGDNKTQRRTAQYCNKI